MNEPFYPVVFI